MPLQSTTPGTITGSSLSPPHEASIIQADIAVKKILFFIFFFFKI